MKNGQLNKKASYGRIIYHRRFFYGNKKRKKYFGDLIIDDVLKMVDVGKTQREMAEYYGSESKKVIDNLLQRHRKKKQFLERGILPNQKGRPRTRPLSTDEEKNYEMKRLKMGNELLWNFTLCSSF